MFEAACYHCGHTNVLDESAPWSPCGDCELPLHVGTVRELMAIERLARSARGEDNLGPQRRDELLALLPRLRGERIAAANALVAPAAPAPVPPPLPPPLPTAATTAVPPPLPPSARERVPAAPDKPSLWARLGPVFTENLLFALAGFLLVAGAVYFTTTAWTTMSGAMQKLVVAGGLLLFAGLTHGAGVVLGREQGLQPAARVLSLVAMALTPAAGIVAGRLFAADALLALLVAGAAAAAGHVFLLALARREGHGLPRAVPWATTALVFAGALAPALSDVRVLASCAVAAVPLLTAWLLRRSCRAAATVPPPASCALLASSFAATAVAVGLALAHAAPVVVVMAPLGIVIAAAALAATVLESARAARAPAVLTAALAAAVSAVLAATGDLRCLMVAAWCAAGTGLQASLRLDRARLAIPALVLSAVGYLFLPAPVRELAAQLRAEAASQLGYEPERLPLSFYGITFLPYLLLLALLCLWFRRTERNRHRRVASAFATSIAAGLAAMSLLLGSDLRAPMAVLPADGLLLVLLGYLGHSAAAVLVGCLGVLGGLACLLIWCEAPAGVATAAVSAGSLVLLGLASRRGQQDGFPPRARHSYAVAATIAAIAAAIWTLSGAWPPERQSLWNLLHAVALAPLLVLFRTPSPLHDADRREPMAPVLLCVPPLWGTATGLAVLLAALGVGTLREAMPTALALATVAATALLPLLRAGDERHLARRWLVAGLFALHAVLLPDLVAAYAERACGWNTVLGTAALAAAAGWLAVRVRAETLLAIAVVEGAFPLHLLAGVLLGEAWGPPGLLGPAALALAAAWFGVRRPAVGTAAAALAAVLGVWLVLHRLLAVPAIPPARETFAALGVAVLLAAVPLWRARERAIRTGLPAECWMAAGGAAVLAGPQALLDLLATGLPGHAGGMLVFAALAFAVAARRPGLATFAAAYGLLQVAIATVLLFVWSPRSAEADFGRLALFAAAAGAAFACRPPRLRTVATLVTAAAGFGAVVVMPMELELVPRRWWPVLVLGWCAAALALTAWPRCAARAFVVRLFGWPTVVVAAVAGVVITAIAAIEQQTRTAADLALLDANSIAFLAAAAALAAHLAPRWRRAVAWTAAAIALSATTPANGLLHGHRAVAFLPDVETALLAAAAAIAVAGRALPRTADLCCALAAVLLTAFDLHDVSTPVTMTLLAAVPLAHVLRGRPGSHAVVHGALLVVAAWSWIAFALVGREGVRLGAWLGLAAAVLGTVNGPWLTFVGRREVPPRQLVALRAGLWLAALGPLLAAGIGSRNVMPAAELLAALTACAMVAIGGARAAGAPGQAPLLHLALAAAISAYVVLATGSDVLAVMAGRHHHALTVLGATLFVAAGQGASPVRRHLRGAAVVLPLLAIVLAIGLGGLTFALLAGALVVGLGAVLARARWLGALALVLANSGLFHLWLHQEVYDPSFYGVPAGLSLVFGAELARRPLGDARVLLLRVAGLAVVYGSVLVQVARVSVPAHALGLFVLAMGAVAWGAVRRQPAIFVTGVVAVVLDVVVYLAQRGFEQDFLGSVLLIGAGGTLFVVAARAARRRAKAARPAG